MFYTKNKIDQLIKDTLKNQEEIMNLVSNIQECLKMQLEMNKVLRLRIEKLEEENNEQHIQ
tara:strand:- start:289 stop:471 length:183 start_codon:yes stop_codon:yes gene_type:complete